MKSNYNKQLNQFLQTTLWTHTVFVSVMNTHALYFALRRLFPVSLSHVNKSHPSQTESQKKTNCFLSEKLLKHRHHNLTFTRISRLFVCLIFQLPLFVSHLLPALTSYTVADCLSDSGQRFYIVVLFRNLTHRAANYFIFYCLLDKYI